MKDPVQLSDDLGSKLCDILSGEDELVSKWAAVAEVIGSDGKRYLRIFSPASAVPWDQIGMLEAALEHSRASWWGDEG